MQAQGRGRSTTGCIIAGLFGLIIVGTFYLGGIILVPGGILAVADAILNALPPCSTASVLATAAIRG